MIMSAKVSKRKVLTGLLVAVAVIALFVVLFSGGGDGSGTTEEGGLSLSAGTNEERLAFLAQYGWEVDSAPVETQEVRVPEEFNEVFTRYNELQQSQGFDLAPLSGKVLKRYVYAITNYPGNGRECYATLLVYKNQVVGGDINCTGGGGSIHGFQKPENTPSPTPPQQSNPSQTPEQPETPQDPNSQAPTI